MKKTIISCLALICAVCACNKQIEIQEPAQYPVQKQIITARVNVASKVAYEENENDGTTFHGLNSTWEEGDKFLAIQNGETVVEFTLVSGAGESEAVFQAEAEDVTETTSWVAVLGNKAVAASSEIHCSYMGQNGTLAGLDDCNYVKAEGTGLEPVFDFNVGEKLSYILRIKLPAGIKCIEYTPCGWNKVTASETTDILFNSASEASDFTSNTTTSVITLPEASAAGDLVYLSIPLLDYSKTRELVNSGKQYQNLRTGVVLTMMNDVSDDATQSFGTVFENDIREKGGKIGTADFSKVTLLARPRPADAITLSASNVKYGDSAMRQAATTVTTHWAPFNIGASEPEQIGW